MYAIGADKPYIAIIGAISLAVGLGLLFAGRDKCEKCGKQAMQQISVEPTGKTRNCRNLRYNPTAVTEYEFVATYKCPACGHIKTKKRWVFNPDKPDNFVA